MHEWLGAARDRLAAGSGVDAAGLELSESEIEALLDLARIAAHESGDRRNAPLVCYLLGLAVARGEGRDVAALARVAAGPTET